MFAIVKKDDVVRLRTLEAENKMLHGLLNDRKKGLAVSRNDASEVPVLAEIFNNHLPDGIEVVLRDGYVCLTVDGIWVLRDWRIFGTQNATWRDFVDSEAKEKITAILEEVKSCISKCADEYGKESSVKIMNFLDRIEGSPQDFLKPAKPEGCY